MKIVKGPPPEDLPKTHVKVLNAAFMRELENYGVPLRRYSEGTGVVWAERWACVLVSEWSELGFNDAFSESVLRRIVRYVHRVGEEDFAEACLAVARLEGRLAVEKMLNDRKDMVR